MSEKKTLSELAQIAGGTLACSGEIVIEDVASFASGRPGTITFYAGKGGAKELSDTKASAIIVGNTQQDIPGFNLILADNPVIAFAKVVSALRPRKPALSGVNPRSELHAGAIVAKSASIGAFAVIEDGAVVGERTQIMPGVYVGHGAQIGCDCLIYPGVVVRDGCIIGDRVTIHSNTVVGSDGFGYAFDGKAHFKIPQAGMVRIGSDVEIGACVTIDRAAIDETVIGAGTKIDNLVQIAHNVRIGPNCIIVAQAGIAGSARLGSFVTIAGQAGVNGHIEIGDGTMLAAKAGATGDLPAKGVFSGMPAIPHSEWLRAQSIFSKLPELKKRVVELEKRLKALEDEK